MSNSVPKRWLPYKAMGDPIPGTRFFAFKVPLKEEICRNLPLKDRFSVMTVLEAVKYLGLVIDLTNTNRYYNPEDLTKRNVNYHKIYCEGQKIPSYKVVKRFFDVVDQFLKDNQDNDKLIGVHCTHGLNRTGYLVCRYMIDKLGFEPPAAIKSFNTARGHPIERATYINALKNKAEFNHESSDQRRDVSLSWRNSSSGPSSHTPQHRHWYQTERTYSRWTDRSLRPPLPDYLPRHHHHHHFTEHQWDYTWNAQRYRSFSPPRDCVPQSSDFQDERFHNGRSYRYQHPWSQPTNSRYNRH